MGCNSSKSTPVVESNGTTGESASSNSLIHKGGELMHQVATDIKDKAADITHKVESLVCDSKGSPRNGTPETQRAQMVDDGDADDDGTREILGDADEENSTVPMRIISIDVDEDNQAELEENQVPIKMSVSLGDSEDQAGTGEKPPTPMPESVIHNAIWPSTITESHEKPEKPSEEITPLDPIAEEKRFVGMPSDDGTTIIEILTLEIAEIPIADEITNTTEQETENNEEVDAEEKTEPEQD